jgi:hypothetical protein
VKNSAASPRSSAIVSASALAGLKAACALRLDRAEQRVAQLERVLRENPIERTRRVRLEYERHLWPSEDKAGLKRSRPPEFTLGPNGECVEAAPATSMKRQLRDARIAGKLGRR